MSKSNIVAESNVFLSREDDPRLDASFLAQVLDYHRLKGIDERKKVDYKIPDFSKVQKEILKTEIRCIYAKNDPCWGYNKSRQKVVSACINGQCPNIWKCNPEYSPGESNYWIPSAEDQRLYGKPEALRRYYIVDMVSEEEMSRYDSKPENDGYEYPVPKNPVLTNDQDRSQEKQRFKTDPVTGKKMVVIGYRWVITDNATYESEELIPIWGSVEEVEEQEEKNAVRKKARRIEKKKDAKPVKKHIGKPVVSLSDSYYERKDKFEKDVAGNIYHQIKLTDVEPELFKDLEDTVILLDNPAELAFVSGTFLVSGVEHGIKTSSGLRLALVDDYIILANPKNVLISNTVLETGCQKANVRAWKALAARGEIILLQVAERDYYQFKYGEQDYRWTCRNMYGVTHVCVEREDICELKDLSDGTYPVSLIDDGQTYMILGKDDELLGRLGSAFVRTIDALKAVEEIPGTPSVINGVSLQVQGNKIEFLGMGHLKFSEY